MDELSGETHGLKSGRNTRYITGTLYVIVESFDAAVLPILSPKTRLFLCWQYNCPTHSKNRLKYGNKSPFFPAGIALSWRKMINFAEANLGCTSALPVQTRLPQYCIRLALTLRKRIWAAPQPKFRKTTQTENYHTTTKWKK